MSFKLGYLPSANNSLCSSNKADCFIFICFFIPSLNLLLGDEGLGIRFLAVDWDESVNESSYCSLFSSVRFLTGDIVMLLSEAEKGTAIT